MGEMAEYYDDELVYGEEGAPEDDGTDLRVFVVLYENGNLHSTTTNQHIAYIRAERIDGIIGELTNVHKPLKEKDIPEPIRSQIIYAIEHPESRVTRDRPTKNAA